MSRLTRPSQPLTLLLMVALRDLGEMPPEQVIAHVGQAKRERRLRQELDAAEAKLAAKFGCQVAELRRDHDPALALRRKIVNAAGDVLRYVPDANDPNHLFYRPHGAQYDGSHDVKTRIRGEHGQHSDRVLIKKNRRMERGAKRRPKAKLPSRSFQQNRCAIGMRCRCGRPERKRCANWRKQRF